VQEDEEILSAAIDDLHFEVLSWKKEQQRASEHQNSLSVAPARPSTT